VPDGLPVPDGDTPAVVERLSSFFLGHSKKSTARIKAWMGERRRSSDTPWRRSPESLWRPAA